MKPLSRKDFVTNQDVRWCPGCGDYAILTNIQKVLPTLGIPRENFVFVSGIGCASRFPYYLNTFGFHTIHGRAPTIATGLKLTRPELSVWVVTGDGDGLSIGSNHLIHLFRRNIDINVLLFNNQIYGLTKGQYSPTSEQGKITKTTPLGSFDRPLDGISLAIASNATFVARCFDIDGPGLQSIIQKAVQHKGTAYIEILQNCNVFNDKAFAHLSDRKNRSENTLWLEHKKPMLFGKEQNKGLRINQDFKFEIIDIKDKKDISNSAIHDATTVNPSLAFALSQLQYPDFPVPMGILRCVETPTYESLQQQKADIMIQQKGRGDLETLFNSGTTWEELNTRDL